MSQYLPFPIIKKYDYPKLEAITSPTGGRKYKIPNNEWVPSVTTILSTLPKEGLDRWRKRIGETEANLITDEASRIGSNMHNNLEGYVSNYIQGVADIKPETEEEKLAYVMAQRIIKFALTDLETVYGIEEAVYCDALYAGRVDLIGIYDGKTSIIDYKSTKKLKKPEWVENYKLQIAAYNFAHYSMFRERMSQGVILMAVRPPSTKPVQIFIMDEAELSHYEDKWLRLVESYYYTIGE